MLLHKIQVDVSFFSFHSHQSLFNWWLIVMDSEQFHEASCRFVFSSYTVISMLEIEQVNVPYLPADALEKAFIQNTTVDCILALFALDVQWDEVSKLLELLLENFTRAFLQIWVLLPYLLPWIKS